MNWFEFHTSLSMFAGFYLFSVVSAGLNWFQTRRSKTEKSRYLHVKTDFDLFILIFKDQTKNSVTCFRLRIEIIPLRTVFASFSSEPWIYGDRR